MIDEILKKYPNDVKIVIKHSPLINFHKQAYKAAQYALAAHKQGKYKEMSDSIFANYTKLKNNENLPIEIADGLGLDMDKFIADSKSDKIKKQIDHEISQFMNSGFERKSVPKFLIQGKEVLGNRDIKTFSRIIDLELNK